ncbi:MAG: class I SAM-dependent methyltransferase [Acidimicrobiia bacterium]|nr:class I SAM-dependent methyltransferase [Acidimicrobiia bacterium]
MEAADWDTRYRAEELVWSAEPNQFVAAHLGELAPGRALDLAAGEGRNAVWLAQLGWQVTALDFSSVAVDKIMRRAEANAVSVDGRCADLRGWKADATYDLVLIAYLQLPRRQESEVVAAAAAAVGAGGTFLFVAHDLSNLVHGHGGPRDPDVLPDVDLVVEQLDGFDIDRAEVAVRAVVTDDGPRQALDTLVIAHRPSS